MDLKANNRIFFDEDSHSYLLDDSKILIGVTSLMKKYGLSADYSGIPEATLRKAAEEGTAIHKEIEDYDNGLSVLNTELIDQYRNLGLKHIASEYIVSDNDIVASAIDGVYEGGGPDSVILIDYKTTAKVHTRALEWQLGIYRALFERQNPGLEVEECFCLHIDKKKRTILGLIPITPVSYDLVDELLDAQRNGKEFSDPVQMHSVESALTEDEIASYVKGQDDIARLKKEIKSVEALIKEYDQRLLLYMQENGLEEMSTGNGVVKIKKGYERKTIDTAKLGKDYPQLLAKYEKVSEVSPSVIYKSNQ